MTAGVVGPNQGQLPLTSPLALFSNGGEREREREREPGIRIFFSHLTPQREQQNDEVSGGVVFFFGFRIFNHCIYN